MSKVTRAFKMQLSEEVNNETARCVEILERAREIIKSKDGDLEFKKIIDNILKNAKEDIVNNSPYGSFNQ